jgi:hypothetical protein
MAGMERQPTDAFPEDLDSTDPDFIEFKKLVVPYIAASINMPFNLLVDEWKFGDPLPFGDCFRVDWDRIC